MTQQLSSPIKAMKLFQATGIIHFPFFLKELKTKFQENPSFDLLACPMYWYPSRPVTWKRLNTETPQQENASKKNNHKTNLMSSSLNLKLKRLYSNDFQSQGRSARPPSLF